jgi:hypothetical protein
MAADLDFDATADVLFDYCDIVALIGPLDWTSFVHGYRAYDAWHSGETSVSLESTLADSRLSAPSHVRVA